MCLGYGDRLLNEVKRLALKDVKIKIYAPPERKYSTWIGGSILAGLNAFKKVGLSLITQRLSLNVRNRCGFRRKNIRRTQTLYTRSSASRTNLFDVDLDEVSILYPVDRLVGSYIHWGEDRRNISIQRMKDA
jgi:hypothetical protein